MADSFKFELVSPERLLVSEDAESVVIPGTEGEMTVMARHAPVMTTLKPGVVTVNAVSGKVDRYVVFGGFADVLPESLTLLAESSSHLDDISPADISERIEQVRKDLAETTDG
ncbi:MAG: F0F1 ATP synthase subunit epsilon, partial [Rhizobiaceae bacterium]